MSRIVSIDTRMPLFQLVLLDSLSKLYCVSASFHWLLVCPGTRNWLLWATVGDHLFRCESNESDTCC